jgi:hypothetical protein
MNMSNYFGLEGESSIDIQKELASFTENANPSKTADFGPWSLNKNPSIHGSLQKTSYINQSVLKDKLRNKTSL